MQVAARDFKLIPMWRRLINPFIWIALTALLGLWPLSRSWWQRSVGQSAYIVGAAGQLGSDKVSALARLTSLDTENKQLREENQRLQSELAHLKEVEKENTALKKEAGAEPSVRGYRPITARVIGHTPVNYLQTMIIDRGERDGLQKGQTVVAQGYLVGQIVSTTQTTSQVSVVINGQLTLPVILQDSRGTGVVRGGLDGLLVSDIPLDAAIKESEMVITQDVGNFIIPDIAVGTVRRVIRHQGDIFQQVLADSPLNFSRLEVVIVLIKE